VTLTAAETTYSKFIGWSACARVPAPTCLVTITDALAHEVTAAFDGPRELALTVSGVNGGTGSVSFGIDPGPYDTCNNLTTNPQICLVRTVGRRW